MPLNQLKCPLNMGLCHESCCAWYSVQNSCCGVIAIADSLKEISMQSQDFSSSNGEFLEALERE